MWKQKYKIKYKGVGIMYVNQALIYNIIMSGCEAARFCLYNHWILIH